MLVFHFLQFVSQNSKCWSCIRIILPAHHHYFIPVVNKTFLLLFARLSFFCLALLIFFFCFIFRVVMSQPCYDCRYRETRARFKNSKKIEFFFCDHKPFSSRDLKVTHMLSTKRYLQFIIHVLWFRHPISFLK